MVTDITTALETVRKALRTPTLPWGSGRHAGDFGGDAALSTIEAELADRELALKELGRLEGLRNARLRAERDEAVAALRDIIEDHGIEDCEDDCPVRMAAARLSTPKEPEDTDAST